MSDSVATRQASPPAEGAVRGLIVGALVGLAIRFTGLLPDDPTIVGLTAVLTGALGFLGKLFRDKGWPLLGSLF